MKTIISLTAIAFLFLVQQSFSQNIGINGTGANAHPSALLDVDDAGTNTKGLLIPRLALTAINVSTPVTAPATSLLVYNTATASTGTNAVSPGYYYWDGVKWVRFAYTTSGSSSEAWTLLGNTGTNQTTHFLGTTDNQDLVFRTNNTEKMRIMSGGNVGIGTNNPLTKLDVRGVVSADVGSLLSPAYTFVGDIQTGIFQPTNGELGIVTSATSYGNNNYRARFSAYEIRVGNNINTLDLGTESKFIIQGSENGPSSNFPFASLGFSNNSNQLGQTSAEIAKILCSSQDATANQGRLELQTKDGTTLVTRVMIDKNGNVGIGTLAPTFKLQVPSGYIGTDYINTVDNAVTSGVTGIMIKAGDNFHRTGNAASVLSFLGVTAPTGDNLGNHTATTILNMNNNFINNAQGSSRFAQSSNTSTSYNDAPIQLRESQYSGGGSAIPPRLAFHWGGVVASQIGIESNGRIAILNNPGTGYENLVSNENFSNAWFRNINSGTGLYNEANGTGIFSPSTGVMAIYNNGSLGIGTNTPSEKLEVQGSVKIVDGTQGAGRVLTSDAAGKATWGTLGPQTSVGTIPITDLIQTQTTAYQYMGYSIVVPAGRSTVSAGVFAQGSDNSMNYYTCQLSGSSAVTGNTTGFSNLPGLCAVVANHQGTAVGTVVYYVNNTSGAPKTLYLWGYASAYTVGGTLTIRGSVSAAEPYIISAY